MPGNGILVCAAGGETYDYGDEIVDDTKTCSNFKIAYGVYESGCDVE